MAVTNEQKEKVLDIPISFENSPKVNLLDNIDMAVLNNIPGNTENEEKQHLKGLAEKASNFSESEWVRVLQKAPFEMMCEEIKDRGRKYIEYRNAMASADDVMRKYDL